MARHYHENGKPICGAKGGMMVSADRILAGLSRARRDDCAECKNKAPELLRSKPDPYPEHTKLRAVSAKSQEIGTFLEWIEEKGWRFATYREDGRQTLDPVYFGTKEKLLAEYFHIDLDKIEAEKRAMLDELRSMNEPG